MIEQQEEWRPVVGYEGSYEVSNRGRVMSVRTHKGYPLASPIVLKPVLSTHGYHVVSLTLRNGVKAKARNVHTLVLTAFVGPRPPGLQCAHLDGCGTNNNLANLAWVTAKENSRHRIIHGTQTRGERTWTASMGSSDARRLGLALAAGMKSADAARLVGV